MANSGVKVRRGGEIARAERTMGLIIGVPKEIYPGERRVSLVPLVIPTLTKAGFEVAVETGAGAEAGYPDNLYTEKGAKIVPTRAELFQAADIITQVLCYGANDVNGKADIPLLRKDQILVGFLRRWAHSKLCSKSPPRAQ